jgi:hypothetical protein
LPVLTEAEVIRRARLQIKSEAGTLNSADRWDLKLLSVSTAPPAATMSLGLRSATGLPFKDLASTKTSPNIPLSEDVRLTSVTGAEFKTLLRQGSATSVGALTTIGRGEYEPVRRPTELLDVMRLGSTEEASVQYMRQTAYSSAAVETGEAVSTSTGTVAEATLPFELISSPVESIDAWVPASRRALADVDELRSVIDDQLVGDCRRRLEAQLIAGTGTTPQLRGLDAVSGIGTQAKGGDSTPLALAKGIALVISAGFAPSALVLHPDDWTDALAVTIPAGGTLSALLELPVIRTAAVPVGTGWVGDWSQIVCWLRSTEVFISQSHSSFFTQGLVAVMAEIRVAVGVLAPAAFTKVTGL